MSVIDFFMDSINKLKDQIKNVGNIFHFVNTRASDTTLSHRARYILNLPFLN
jgi:hypothetical protein